MTYTLHPTRLCLWEVLLEDGRILYHHCIHLDGEFNVCKIHRPQFDQREQADREFLESHIGNDYAPEEWIKILTTFEKEVGIRYPCDSNISGSEVDEMIHTQVSILCISERMCRTCDSCAWYDVNDEECLANKIGYVNDFEDVMKSCDGDIVPCRFHLTKDELCQILDPYFME